MLACHSSNGFCFGVQYRFHMHVAHGATYVVGAYIAWGLIAEAGLPIWLGIIITIVGCGILGVVMELIIYRPIRRTGGNIASFLLASIGLTWVIQNICGLIAGTAPQFLGKEWKVIYHIGDVYFSNMDIFLVVACILVFVFFVYFLNHTSVGISIKAVASNPKLAGIWGASIDKGLTHSNTCCLSHHCARLPAPHYQHWYCSFRRI